MSDLLHNELQRLRTQRGWTQQELADRASLSRQSIVAIEAGKMTPSVAIALRLSAALGRPVDALFWLDANAAQVRVRRAAGDADAVRLAAAVVAGQWVAHPMPPDDADSWSQGADALQVSAVDEDGTALAELLRSAEVLRETWLVSGCDPALALLAAHARERQPECRLVAIQATSGAALRHLADGLVHLAGSHVRDPATGEFNAPAIRARLPGRRVMLFNVARWDLGIVVASGNPLHVRSVVDLAQPNVRLVQRSADAAAQLVLEQQLAQTGLSKPARTVTAGSHRGVAQLIALGSADAGIATVHAARTFGLEFQPLEESRFDLAVPVELAATPRFARILEVLESRAFQRELSALQGYGLEDSGQLMAEVG